MKAVLVRIAADHSYGKWNGPAAEGGEFVYVPIPESEATTFRPNHERSYQELLPALQRFAAGVAPHLQHYACLPDNLQGRAMHLDPDFENLTYGDDAASRGRDIARMNPGDVIAFYAGLRPTYSCSHKLLYALVGLYVIQQVFKVMEVPEDRLRENAHTRKAILAPSDIIVRARPGASGRMERCIPFGEYRDRAYRVRHDILEEWGGLSVANGFVQRSAVPPRFLDPDRFYDWFRRQNVRLSRRNF